MTYTEAIHFLYSQLPMYSRIGAAAYRKDLINTLKLCELLAHPEKKFRSIHVAGTNGKGSTCHMLAAILQTAGFKTGLYTSPHLKDFRERIRINGEMISENQVTKFVEKYKDDVLKIGCSFFEWTVGLAFNYFAEEKVDIAIIETGLGGRLDSTNVITPVLSVITNISYDHMDLLGDTLEKIAAEKAGIIKPNIPVVIGRSDSQTKAIFISRAHNLNAPISFADIEWSSINSSYHESYSETTFIDRNKRLLTVRNDLPGEYQLFNLSTVLTCCDVLNQIGFEIKEDSIVTALLSVKTLTGLRGRWEIFQHDPLVIADVAHNEEGLRFALSQLKEFYASSHQLLFVIGFVKEKDLRKILPLFPKSALYYFCCPDIPRGLNASELRNKATEFGLNGSAFPSAKDAFQAALQEARSEDVIYIGGSTFVVAEVI
ncbi:MAG: bifunctional folylpolyglutamate synthase/dihydrofolate synthase [Chitinophagales bacterium]